MHNVYTPIASQTRGKDKKTEEPKPHDRKILRSGIRFTVEIYEKRSWI